MLKRWEGDEPQQECGWVYVIFFLGLYAFLIWWGHGLKQENMQLRDALASVPDTVVTPVIAEAFDMQCYFHSTEGEG